MFSMSIIKKSDTKILNVAVVDKNFIIYNNSANELKFLDLTNKQIRLTLKVKNKEKDSLFCLSSNKKMLAYVSGDEIYIVNTTLKSNNRDQRVKIVNQIKIKEDVTYIKFDPSSRYLFVGTINNLVYQYKYNIADCVSAYDMFHIFKKRTQGITSIEFFHSTMIVSGNRGDLVKVNIFSKISKNLLLNESTTINDISLLDAKHLITGHENGEVRVVTMETLKSYTQIDTPFTSVKQIIFLHHKRYMLIHNGMNQIALLDSDTKKCIAPQYISCEKEIKSLFLISDYLLMVLTSDNTLIQINLPTPEQLDSLIIHGSLDDAYNLVSKDPILKESSQYQNLEERYQEIIQRVAGEIPYQNKDFALQTIDFFKNIKTKKNEINLIFEAFDRYEKLRIAVIAKDYEEAYYLVERFPIFKSLKEYRIIESIFRNKLQQAQDFLIKGQKQEANALIGKYMPIKSKQAIVKLFLNHGDKFLPYLSMIKKKDIEGLRDAVQRDTSLLYYLQYMKIDLKEQDIDKEITQFDYFLHCGELDKAKKILKGLEKNLLSELYLKYEQKLLDMEKLYMLYAEKEILQCYTFIDRHEHLSSSKIALSFEHKWKKIILQIEEYLFLGEEKKADLLLNKYSGLELRKEKINDLKHYMYSQEIDDETIDINTKHLFSTFTSKMRRSVPV